MVDKGLEALEKFYKEFLEDNPRHTTLLARAATETYILNTERDGKPKSGDAGKKIYEAMFNCLRDEVYVPKGNFNEYPEKIRDQVEGMIREDIGIEGVTLEDLIKKGIDFVSFSEGVVKAIMGNFGKRLDKLSEGVLKPEYMTESAKTYLVERAKKLELRGLEGLTKENIRSIEEFRHIARKIAEHKRGS